VFSGKLTLMADTLTIPITPEAAEKLRTMAADRGETVEALAQRVLQDVAESGGGESLLSEEQQADLRERIRNPGRMLSKAESDAFFDRLLGPKEA
jgi:hypothetical protein